ncbi:hypothetical protein EDB86DRAFT_1421644 [Lactarius hatsudake]|nr:hypothetical protein EDB86DRAFT_1421644 [Lactarius hatsudake]
MVCVITVARVWENCPGDLHEVVDRLWNQSISIVYQTPISGSLLIAWQLKDKHALVIGGGEFASSRIQYAQPLHAAEVLVTAISFPQVLKFITILFGKSDQVQGQVRRPEQGRSGVCVCESGF